MRVPLLNLTRQFESMRRELLAEVEKVFDSQMFILGTNVAALESELAEDLGVEHAIGVSSGTDALLLALMALGVGPGDEVVVPSFSFFASAGVVSRLSAIPVFADVEPTTLNLSAAAFEAKITSRTRVVIPVHLYGQCADMDAIGAVARRHGIAMVEDACQAIGSRWGGRAAGTIGEIGAFSFFPTKNLGAAGDAGLVATSDGALGDRMRHLRVHGMNPKYFHAEIGGNFRLDEVQAAVLRVKRKRLAAWNARRGEIAFRYRELLASAGDRIRLPVVSPPAEHTYHQFVVRLAGRDEVRSRLAQAGVGSEVYYPVPLHLQKCFESLGGRVGDCPEAERAAAEVLALPIWPEMTDTEIEIVTRELLSALA